MKKMTKMFPRKRKADITSKLKTAITRSGLKNLLLKKSSSQRSFYYSLLQYCCLCIPQARVQINETKQLQMHLQSILLILVLKPNILRPKIQIFENKINVRTKILNLYNIGQSKRHLLSMPIPMKHQLIRNLITKCITRL